MHRLFKIYRAYFSMGSKTDFTYFKKKYARDISLRNFKRLRLFAYQNLKKKKRTNRLKNYLSY